MDTKSASTKSCGPRYINSSKKVAEKQKLQQEKLGNATKAMEEIKKQQEELKNKQKKEVTVEDTFDNDIFINKYTFLLKICIFANQGTKNEKALKTCIELHNKLKEIEVIPKEDRSEADNTFVRIILKRFNMSLKIDAMTKPLDLKNGDHQNNILKFNPHSSITNGAEHVNGFIKFYRTHKLGIYQHISYDFLMIQEEELSFSKDASRYRRMIWEHIRSLFYISQIVLCNIISPEDKDNFIDKCCDMMEPILITLNKLDKNLKLEQKISQDKFVAEFCVKVGVDKYDLEGAKKDIMKKLEKRGLGNNPAIKKMIDSIGDKVTGLKMNSPDFMSNMQSIIDQVTVEIKPEMEKDPESMKQIMKAMISAFDDLVKGSAGESGNIPEGLAGMVATAKKIIGSGMLKDLNIEDDTTSPEDQKKALIEDIDQMIIDNNMDRDEVYARITDNKGEIDFEKLQVWFSEIWKMKHAEIEKCNNKAFV